MAEKKVFEIEINGIQREINNVKDLKKAMKDVNSELLNLDAGSEAFVRAQKKVSVLKDKMGDLNDVAKIQGTGVERLGQSFSLLGESLMTGDIDKAKIAFSGLGAAMEAIPIFLLIQGITLLIENFDKIIDYYYEWTGQIDKSVKSTEELNAELKKQKEQIDEVISSSQTHINRSIEIVKLEEKIKDIQAEGGNRQKELNELKKQSIQLQIDELKVALAAKSGLLTVQEELALKTQIYVKEQEKARIDIVKQEEVKNKAIVKDNSDKDEALFQQAINSAYKIQDAEVQATLDKAARIEAINREQDNKEFQARQKASKERLDLEAQEQAEIDALNKKAEEDFKKSEAAKSQAVSVGLQASKMLSDAYFTNQLNKAKGNQAEELKIKKQMFEVDKAFNVARAIQDGIRSVQAALTIPPPGGQILAGVNAALAAANVAQIAATKFDAGGSVPSIPTLPTSNSAPTINTPQPNTFQGQVLNNQGQPITAVNKSYVVSAEMSEAQKRDLILKNQSTF